MTKQPYLLMQNELPAVRWVGGPEIEVRFYSPNPLGPLTNISHSSLLLPLKEGSYRDSKIYPRKSWEGWHCARGVVWDDSG